MESDHPSVEKFEDDSSHGIISTPRRSGSRSRRQTSRTLRASGSRKRPELAQHPESSRADMLDGGQQHDKLALEELHDVEAPSDEETDGASDQGPKMIGPHKKWEPGLVDKLRKFLLSITFQAAVQTATGVFLICCFYFSSEIRFTIEYIAGIFVILGLVLASFNPHLGARTLAAAFITTLALPAIIAGVVIEVASLTGAFQVWYTILVAVIWVPLAVIRAHDFLQGLINSVLFAIVTIIGLSARGYALWHTIVFGLVRVSWVTAFCCWVAGWLLLASSARDATAKHWACHAISIGHALSAVSSHLLAPPHEDGEHGKLQEAKAEMTTDAADLNTIQRLRRRAIDPSSDHSLRHEKDPAVKTIGSLRPSLMQSQLLLKTAPFEPPWFGNCRIQLSKWAPLYGKLETVATRVAVLESLLESSACLIKSRHISEVFGVDPLPTFRGLTATLAASLAGVGKCIRATAAGNTSVAPCMIATHAEGAITEEVRGVVQRFHQHWDKRNKADPSKPTTFMHICPERQMLLVLRLQAMSLLDDIAALEALVSEACRTQHIYTWPWRWSLRPPQPDPEKAQKHSALQENAQQDPGTTHAATAPHRKLEAGENGKDHSPAPPGKSSGKAKGKANGKRKGRDVIKERLMGEVGWIIAFLSIMFYMPLIGLIGTVFHESIPNCFGSPSKAWHTIRYNRLFHYGVKYYLVVMGTSVVLINLSIVSSFIGNQRDYFALLALIVTFQERMDAAVTRAVIRAAAVAISGTFGFAVMWKYDVATNPYGLTAILCVWAALIGTQAFGPFKYAAFLGIMIMDAMVLNQYTGKSTGTVHYYVGRVVFYMIGIVLAMLAQFVSPWYLAGNGIERLGVAAQNAADVGCDIFLAYLEELQLLSGKGDAAEAGKTPRSLRKRVAATFRNMQPKDRPEDAHETEHTEVGLHRLDLKVISTRIADPLGATILQVAKEKVLWKQGLFTLPPTMSICIKSTQALLERVAFLNIAARQPARIRGRFTAAPWHGLYKELQPQLQRHIQAVQALGAALKAAMAEHACSADMQALDSANTALTGIREETDMEFRNIVLDFRERIVSGDPEPEKIMASKTEDDTMRALSMLLAFGRFCNKLQLFAGRLLQDDWLNRRNERTFRYHRDMVYVFG